MDSLYHSSSANVFLLRLLLFAVLLHKGMCTLKVQCNEKDHHALLNFKHSVVDPSAIFSTWADERDCCEWRGVQCDNTTGRVIKLSLPCSAESSIDGCGDEKAYCLSGELSLSMLQLEFLNYLDLSNNDLRAILPNNITMANLRYLDLSYNEELHVDNLDFLSPVSSLKYIDFSGIDLQGRVDWLQLATLLPSLTELHLDSCRLENINPSLRYANFTSLEAISLSNNDFGSDFPGWLFNLSEITAVNLSYNYFHGQLPERLLNLQKIKSLDFHSNKLVGPIPSWLGQLEHLQVLDVGDNSFSGIIPSTLGNLSSLINLDVSSNQLNGSLPKSLGQLLNLEVLCFCDNHLTGDVSETNFIKLSNLKYLCMGSPSLMFDFGALWVPPFQLNVIYLQHMVGSKLPSWVYTQTSLTRLIITYSRISFEPQDKFWDFAAQVRAIGLHNNTIDGDMSNVLLNSTIIYWTSNTFRGGLPKLSPNVVLFGVANNSLQGSISSLLCQKVNGRNQLRYLDMSNNFLSGGLTNCWMNWKSLVIVRLGGNNLTGTIPSSMGFLSNLTILHLNKNNLSGEIPLSLKNCHNLQNLDVLENKISGNIPNWIGHKAKVLRLRSNQLNGVIPPQICQLTSLTILDFANNEISGAIPDCIYNITAMSFPGSSYHGVPTFCVGILGMTYRFGDNVMLHIKYQDLIYKEHLKLVRAIDLSSNNMAGTIPPKIFSLIGLQSLNLSHNQFDGDIPKEIGNLKQLESLDFAKNRFSGEIPQSMSELYFLGSLNLSFNNFTGMIPSGTQLQGFDPSSYMGNPQLCGAPLSKNCTDKEDGEHNEENDNQKNEFWSFFYIGWGVGFATTFWGIYVAILFNMNFRHYCFKFLGHIKTNFM